MAQLEARAQQDFYRLISQALVEIQPEESTRNALIAKIIKPEPANLTDTDAKELVEILDTLVQEIKNGKGRNRCLCILSEICREKLILPKRYIVSPVKEGTKSWKSGRVTDIWTGKLDGDEVCIKHFRIQGGNIPKKLKGEFYHRIVRNQWKGISHDNVLPFLGVSETFPPFSFVNRRLPNNILEYIDKHKDANRLSLLANAAHGLEHLHSLGIVHGSIHPGNILVTMQGTACIADFEISGIVTHPTITRQGGSTAQRSGVVRYLAPEQARPKKFTMEDSNPRVASDVYSFAMTAFEVLTGRKPYSEAKSDGLLAVSIVGDVRPLRPSAGDAIKWLPDLTWKAMECCWIPEPHARPPIKDMREALQKSVTNADNRGSEGEEPQSASTGGPLDGGTPLRISNNQRPNATTNRQGTDLALNPQDTGANQRSFWRTIKTKLRTAFRR